MAGQNLETMTDPVIVDSDTLGNAKARFRSGVLIKSPHEGRRRSSFREDPAACTSHPPAKCACIAGLPAFLPEVPQAQANDLYDICIYIYIYDCKVPERSQGVGTLAYFGQSG
jgi:hypothetical protein